MGAYVVVSGPPASGKSTLAPALAAELGLPLLAKDVVKEALLARAGEVDLEESRRLGRLAVDVLLAVAASVGTGAVLESVWYASRSASRLSALPGPVVEVHCRCPGAELERRHAARAACRMPGHLDAARPPAELWEGEVARPVAGGWPVLEVDTSAPVDVTALTERVRRALAS